MWILNIHIFASSWKWSIDFIVQKMILKMQKKKKKKFYICLFDKNFSQA